MGLVLTATFGLILWLVLWAMGIKSIDGFMLTIILLILAMIARLVVPLIPGLRKD